MLVCKLCTQEARVQLPALYAPPRGLGVIPEEGQEKSLSTTGDDSKVVKIITIIIASQRKIIAVVSHFTEEETEAQNMPSLTHHNQCMAVLACGVRH